MPFLECEACDGSGECPFCGGTGIPAAGAAVVEREEDQKGCPACNGTGTCHECEGTGQIWEDDEDGEEDEDD